MEQMGLFLNGLQNKTKFVYYTVSEFIHVICYIDNAVSTEI
jgi:hypothetical protein